MERTVFNNPAVYWVLVVSLGAGLLWSAYTLTTGFNILVVLRLLWMAALLFLVVTKHKKALINLKWWLIIAFIVGPALSLVGRLLNEMLDGFTSFSVEFYLYRSVALIIGLILLNYIRSTVTVEQVESN